MEQQSQSILLTIQEAANLLNVKVSWMRSKVFARGIPYLKVGKLIRFQKEELLKWVKSSQMDVNRK